MLTTPLVQLAHGSGPPQTKQHRSSHACPSQTPSPKLSFLREVKLCPAFWAKVRPGRIHPSGYAVE